MNRCVAKVQMYDTEIKDECAKEMAQALTVNKSLKHLNLGWNSFSPKYLTTIQKLTKDNLALEREELCPQQKEEIIKLSKATS